jgi:hypothetical protein
LQLVLGLFDFSLEELCLFFRELLFLFVCCGALEVFLFLKEWKMAPPSKDSFNGIVSGVDQQHVAAVLQQPIGRLVPLPEGPACVLAMATAFPPTVIQQDTYHDKLFELCNVADDVVLKARFKRICECTRNYQIIMEAET